MAEMTKPATRNRASFPAIRAGFTTSLSQAIRSATVSVMRAFMGNARAQRYGSTA